MNLKAYDMTTREAIMAAAQDRELFTLCSNGLSADYLVKSIIVQCDHQGEYVYAELCQASEALLTPPSETPAPWSGPEDGLPPVGLEVEFCNPESGNGKEWVRGTVQYLSKVTAVMRHVEFADGRVESVFFPVPGRFRVAKSLEQLAADKRLHELANALTRVCKEVERHNVDLNCSVAIRATVEAMIDAGYRKFEIGDEQP